MFPMCEVMEQCSLGVKISVACFAVDRFGFMRVGGRVGTMVDRWYIVMWRSSMSGFSSGRVCHETCAHREVVNLCADHGNRISSGLSGYVRRLILDKWGRSLFTGVTFESVGMHYLDDSINTGLVGDGIDD